MLVLCLTGVNTSLLRLIPKTLIKLTYLLTLITLLRLIKTSRLYRTMIELAPLTKWCKCGSYETWITAPYLIPWQVIVQYHSQAKDKLILPAFQKNNLLISNLASWSQPICVSDQLNKIRLNNWSTRFSMYISTKFWLQI